MPLQSVKKMSMGHEQAVINSALWAAAGDAIGWITELAREGTIEARTGISVVDRPVEWQRFIGGRSGVKVTLPAGTYSDDTQLRLAVSRSIRGNGAFDAEAFARIELTVWQSYALGAGRGTKAAAGNLAKRGVNWFSNFFDEGSRYVDAGGNGAAMRIQPHVWSMRSGEQGAMVTAVLRDAIVTHGHPHGFVGAAFHALALADALDHSFGTVSGLFRNVESLSALPKLIKEDRQLETFWRPAWENQSNKDIGRAVSDIQDEIKRDIDVIAPILESGSGESYIKILENLGCLTEKLRGSGIKTALAASVLAILYTGDPEAALIASANSAKSDTDTIGTMAGAILGACNAMEPSWPIQDRDYILVEARRLSSIAAGEQVKTFRYPDLSVWQPPANQSDAIAEYKNGFALLGLGAVEPQGKEYRSGSSIWQWMTLPFGQSVLAKRRLKLKGTAADNQLPNGTSFRVISKNGEEGASSVQSKLPFENRDVGSSSGKKDEENSFLKDRQGKLYSKLDELTDEVIKSNFDDRTLGRLLNFCIDSYGTIESATAFAAIVAKAKLVRRRRDPNHR